MSQKLYICPRPCKQATECSHRVKHERQIKRNHHDARRVDLCQAISPYCPECEEVLEC